MGQDFDYSYSAIDPLWNLHDSLTLPQAASLLIGHEPTEVESRLGDTFFQAAYPRYPVAMSLLSRAVNSNAIPMEYDSISVDDLKAFLSQKRMRTGFFFPDGDTAPDYMNPRDSRYAPKLAAAVSAWQAVTTAGKTSPKQALAKWLREHAATYGLSDDEGKPNETGIEEVAKVANWQPTGGAAKTPG
jgi:hypothetical protein